MIYVLVWWWLGKVAVTQLIHLQPAYPEMNSKSKVVIATSLVLSGSLLLFYLYWRSLCQGGADETDSGAAAVAATNITKYGKPQLVEEIRKPGYLIVFCNRTRTPVYVIEKLTTESLGVVEREGVGFHKEDPTRTAPLNSDYVGSGFDRGHLAAAANHSASEEALAQTFSLCNIVPQFPACNRGNWKILENHTRALVGAGCVVYVYSGPMYIPQNTSSEKFVVYQVIGANNVAVPTHMFKILVIEAPRLKPQLECYVVENVPDPKHKSLLDMKVGLGAVEKWTGLIFDKLHKYDN